VTAEPPTAGFDYPALLRVSLIGLIRQVLRAAAEAGLPGDHHFFLTFKTQAEGTSLSSRLLRQHPEEMTIVLQHQFQDLEVADDRFSVTLRFGGVPERLSVPFEALTAFVDPSVGFGLRLQPDQATAREAGSEAGADGDGPATSPITERPGTVVPFRPRSSSDSSGGATD